MRMPDAENARRITSYHFFGFSLRRFRKKTFIVRSWGPVSDGNRELVRPLKCRRNGQLLDGLHKIACQFGSPSSGQPIVVVGMIFGLFFLALSDHVIFMVPSQ